MKPRVRWYYFAQYAIGLAPFVQLITGDDVNPCERIWYSYLVLPFGKNDNTENRARFFTLDCQ